MEGTLRPGRPRPDIKVVFGMVHMVRAHPVRCECHTLMHIMYARARAKLSRYSLCAWKGEIMEMKSSCTPVVNVNACCEAAAPHIMRVY